MMRGSFIRVALLEALLERLSLRLLLPLLLEGISHRADLEMELLNSTHDSVKIGALNEHLALGYLEIVGQVIKSQLGVHVEHHQVLLPRLDHLIDLPNPLVLHVRYVGFLQELGEMLQGGDLGDAIPVEISEPDHLVIVKSSAGEVYMPHCLDEEELEMGPVGDVPCQFEEHLLEALTVTSRIMEDRQVGWSLRGWSFEHLFESLPPQLEYHSAGFGFITLLGQLSLVEVLKFKSL